MFNNMKLKFEWKKITTNIITYFILGVIGTGIGFYINTKITHAEDIEKEKQQVIKIDNAEKNIIKLFENDRQLQIKIDSTIVKNNHQFNVVVDKIDKVGRDVKILTYAVTKDNKQIKEDIKELKKINEEENWALK